MGILQQITSEYLRLNGISIKFFAECIGIDYILAYKWLNGRKTMSDDKIKMVYEFIEGKYYKKASEIKISINN